MFISLKGWERFQHYKDRDPPWVKLYRDLLTSESWVLGTDTSRLVQVASVLLAARYTNKIPYSWNLIRKVSSLECTQEQFDVAVQHLVTTDFLEVQRDTGFASDALATCNTTSGVLYSEAEQSKEKEEAERERDARARAAPRGTVIEVGSNLTRLSTAQALASVLEDWRRDVPEANPDAFSKWIVHVELSGRPMNPSMRLAQARRLAGNGDFSAQAEVVTFCCENGYKALIPIGDVRARTQGMRRPAHTPAPTTAELEAREAARGAR